MTELLFTADGLLRERARGVEGRVLSHVVEGSGATGARLHARGEEYEVVPLAQGGWAFELRDRHGAPSGGFQPFRLRRGGRLHVRSAAMSLHGRPWSHEGWAFSLSDGQRVDATVKASGELGSNGDRPVPAPSSAVTAAGPHLTTAPLATAAESGRAASAAEPGEAAGGCAATAGDGRAAAADPGSPAVQLAVVLEAVGPLELGALAEVLALGSWLIARWQLTPAADHVLASAGIGTGLAGAGAKASVAGARAQPAN